MLGELIERATAGVTGALPYDPFEYCLIAAGTAIAWAYTIELDLVIFYTFRRRKGLYFWALLISSWGCTLHALGFILKFLVGTTWLVELPFIEVGWVSMVTGQAFVLYSRLHLVVRNQRTLRLLLYMIIIDAICFHIPTIVFTYGSNSTNAEFWTPKFNVMERIQLVGFCLQEFIISTVYIMATVRLLGSIYHSMTRKVMVQLIAINSICIGMDIVLIGLEFSNQYVGEAAIKPMIYSIKLKLEFAVLNQLMGLTKAGFTEENRWRGKENGHELRERGYAHGSKVDNGESAIPDRKAGTWTTAKVGSFSGNRMSMAHPDQIYATHQVDVITEPKNKDNSLASSTTTAVTVGDAHHQRLNSNGNGIAAVVPAKAKSLMGTTMMAGRNPRISSRPDPEGRNHSPTESEKEICRRSTDSEKEGTRWIEGGV